MTISHLVPTKDIFSTIDKYHGIFDKKGVSPDDRVGFVIGTFYDNAKMMKERGIDFWLSFGATLPAVERVIAMHNGESETAFYRRTGYPKNVVDAYSVMYNDDVYNDFGTLVFADWYKNQHLAVVPANTSVWQISTDGLVIDLDLFENRLNGLK